MVYRRLAWTEYARLRELIALGKRSALTETEQTEVDTLVDEADSYTLLRSRPLLLPKERGHDIEARLKLGA